MNGFIDSLVSRFNGAENTVSPRLPGKFESSYTNEPGILIDTETAITSNSSLLGIPSHPEDLQPSLVPEQRLFTNKTNKYDQKEDRTDPTFSPDSGQIILKNIPVNNEGDPEQNNLTQKDIGAFNGQSESFRAGITDNNYFVREVINDRTTESGSITGRSTTIILPSGVGQMIEKEKQRNEIDRPVSTQMMIGQNRRDNSAIQNLNDHDQTPIIRVSIGRIEVRAVPVTNTANIKDHSPQKPKMSLEEYLQKRNNR
jgi:hypothetical protein